MPTGVAVSKTNRVFVELPALGRPGRVHRRRDRRTARSSPFPSKEMNEARTATRRRSSSPCRASSSTTRTACGSSTPAASTSARPSRAGQARRDRPEDEQGRQDDPLQAGRRAADDVPQRRPLRPQPRRARGWRSSPTRRDPGRTASSSSTSRRGEAGGGCTITRRPRPSRTSCRSSRASRSWRASPGKPRGVHEDRLRRHRDQPRQEDALLLPARSGGTCTA